MGYSICIYIYIYIAIYTYRTHWQFCTHCLLDYQAYGYFRWDLGKIFQPKDCLEIELVSDCQNIRGTFKLSINSMSFIGDFEVEFSWLLPFLIRSVSHVKIMQLLYFKCYMRRWEENKIIWKWYEVAKRRFLSREFRSLTESPIVTCDLGGWNTGAWTMIIPLIVSYD